MKTNKAPKLKVNDQVIYKGLVVNVIKDQYLFSGKSVVDVKDLEQTFKRVPVLEIEQAPKFLQAQTKAAVNTCAENPFIKYEMQILKMVELQNSINSKVNPNWPVAGYNWMLAGAMEFFEAIEGYGWKWWKAHKTVELSIIQNELVDYWHFVLSQSIIHGDGSEGAFYWLQPSEGKPSDVFTFDNKGYVIAELSVVDKMFLLVGLAASKRFEFYLFQSLMADLDFSWNELYLQYIGKNVLNMFRQKNGYKSGEYQKHYYDGREDNYHMIDAINENRALAGDPDVFMQEIEFCLARSYAETIAQKA
jgi:dimeric dUTPase (all-alpha-NTP-PPase superfamily)